MCSDEVAMRASKVKLLDLLSDPGLRAIETKTAYFSTRMDRHIQSALCDMCDGDAFVEW